MDEGDPEVVFFASAAQFREWLEANHESADELWMGLYRTGDPRQGLTWADAVLEALCFGWIDSTSRRIDETARRQRWTPRRPRSVWSAVNVAHVERLIAQGRMRPAGLAAYERRTPERTGVYSYEQPGDLEPAARAALAAQPAAEAFWEAATAGYRRLAAGWVTGAKREATRESRLAALIECCASGRLIPPQRYGEPPAWLARAAQAAASAR